MGIIEKLLGMTARIALLLLVAAMVGCSGVSAMTPGQMSWIQRESDRPRAGNVYVIRGLIGFFSAGTDQLAVEINKGGVRSYVFQQDQTPKTMKAIVDTYKNSAYHEPLVLAGHSLGADDVITIARELDKHNVPVDALITLDPTRPPKVPKNVKICYNYYQPSIWDGTGILRGIPLETEPGFKGVMLNMNVRTEYKDLLEWDTNHVNIDKNTKIHADIVKRLQQICPPREQWVAQHPSSAKPVSQGLAHEPDQAPKAVSQ